MGDNPDKGQESEDLRELRKKGIEITWAGLLGHLRSIKQIEMQWVIVYSGVTIPAIGVFLASTGTRFPATNSSAIVIAAIYFLISAWMIYVLYQERQSYFTVLRCVQRAQNLYRLYGEDCQFFPDAMKPYESQKGSPYWFNLTKGTKFLSSFLHRLLYVIGLNLGVTYAIFHQRPSPTLCWENWQREIRPELVSLILNLLIVIIIYVLDVRAEVVRSNEELAGSKHDDCSLLPKATPDKEKSPGATGVSPVPSNG